MTDFIFITKGVFLTFQLVVCSLLIGFFAGSFLAILRYTGRMVRIINFYISIVRGTPLILQLSFFYFAIPGLVGIKSDLITTAIITFGLNSTAYISEIIRAGIESVPKKQFEASQALRIPTYYMWKDIIFPQVLRNIFPSLINETISLLKETALISTLGGMDIMRRAQLISAEKFTYFMPISIAGAIYYVLALCIESFGKTCEAKWKKKW